VLGVTDRGVAHQDSGQQAAEGQDDDADQDTELDGERAVGEPAGSTPRGRGGGVALTEDRPGGRWCMCRM